MSIKYSIIKGVFHIVPVQRMMAKPYEELIKMFKTAEAKSVIPKMEDPELTISTRMVGESPVLEVLHNKKKDFACIYVAGGGMLKYPKPSQAKSMISLAKVCKN